MWLRRGEGFVAVAGMPPVAYIRIPGGVAERASRMAEAWQALTSDAAIDDAVQVPGTGLIGFTALAFDARSAVESILVVPAVIVGARGSPSPTLRPPRRRTVRSGRPRSDRARSAPRGTRPPSGAGSTRSPPAR